jgi:hypothetical protein
MITETSTMLLLALGLLGVVFAVEAVYALFFRDFGRVTFRVEFEARKVDAAMVWNTYFEESNAWNSVSERLAYEVISENPRVVRTKARLRGVEMAPVTTEFRVDVLTPQRAARVTTVKVDGAPVAEDQQTYEVFELIPNPGGVRVKVEAGIPVRGWLRMPLHRRNLARIYQDLHVECLTRANVAFDLVERPDVGAMVWRAFGAVAAPFWARPRGQ